MSLKNFHFFFVFVSILLCTFLFYWGLSHRTASVAPLLMGCSAVGFITLVFYALWMPRKWKNV